MEKMHSYLKFFLCKNMTKRPLPIWMSSRKIQRLEDSLNLWDKRHPHTSAKMASGPFPMIRPEVKPMDHQLRAAAFIADQDTRLSSLVAYGPGLGKTLSVLLAASVLLRRDLLQSMLVVVPANLLFHWSDEIKRHTVFSYRVLFKQSDFPNSFYTLPEKIIIVSYDGLRIYKKTHEDALRDMKWSLIALDESQRIRNASTETFKTVMALQSERRVCMTGTAIINHGSDLYAQAKFLRAHGNGTKSSDWMAESLDCLTETHPAVKFKRSHMLMYANNIRKDVEGIPILDEETVWIPYEGDYLKFYMTTLIRFYREAGYWRTQKKQSKVLACLLRIIQFCDHPALSNLDVTEEELIKADVPPKLKQLLRDLEKKTKERRRVHVHFRQKRMLEIAKKIAEHHGIQNIQVIVGSTSMKQRDRLLKEFNSTPAGTSVILFSTLKCTSEGVNIFAEEVYMYNEGWSDNDCVQAFSRARRFGSPFSRIKVHRYCGLHSIEQAIAGLHIRKVLEASSIYEESMAGKTHQQISSRMPVNISHGIITDAILFAQKHHEALYERVSKGYTRIQKENRFVFAFDLNRKQLEAEFDEVFN